MILSGCEDIDDHYSSIEKDFISDIVNDTDLEYIDFKGHSDNWAVVYIAYRLKGADNFKSSLIAKYIGSKPIPTGEISYEYDADSDVASGISHLRKEIYLSVNSGTVGNNELMPMKKTKVKLQIGWNEKSDFIELESK